jgi:hypothetical protein
MPRGRPARPPGEPTARNIEVLQALVDWGTFARAAEKLFVSPHTVDWHIDVLRKISGCRMLPGVISWGYSNGYLVQRIPLDRPSRRSRRAHFERDDLWAM